MKINLLCFVKSKTKGNTLVELIIVMSMIALLGGAIISLISTGGNSFKRISDNSKAENEARIAMSYVTVKIRQNDISGGINVLGELVDSDSGEKISSRILRIKNPSSPGNYWYIYGLVGAKQLVEDDGDSVTTPVVIAEDVEFDVSMDASNRQLDLTIKYLNGTKVLKEIITLRTD